MCFRPVRAAINLNRCQLRGSRGVDSNVRLSVVSVRLLVMGRSLSCDIIGQPAGLHAAH